MSQATNPSQATAPLLSLIPVPVRTTIHPGEPFQLRGGLQLAAPAEAVAEADRLVELLTDLTGITLDISSVGEQGDISLALSPRMSLGLTDWQAREAYRIEIASSGIILSAASTHGLSNAVQTLSQLFAGDATVPAGVIEDYPRFEWRGLMLDCGRHLFSVAEIRRFLDWMALHKFNTFHWHLTEDQGWRLPIEKYPLLTEIGAWRNQSPVMGNAAIGDGIAYGGFYTREQIVEVVAHAARRHIQVVPEIELPGHSTAAIAAYPWLGNDDIPDWMPPRVSEKWSIHKMTLSPRERTFQFIEQVFDEVLGLFPCPYVHIGADESPKDQWRQSPSAQQIMRREGLADENQLQAWFIRRVEKMLHARGKRLVGWDEIQEGGLSPTATMMVWRSWDWAALALERGNDVIMAPKSHTYLDYSQGPHPQSPEYQSIGDGKNWAPSLLLETVSEFDPMPPGTPPHRQQQLLGCQGQLWSEYTWSYDKLEYQAFPRACAIAEAGWSSMAARAQTPIDGRLPKHLENLGRLGVNYRRSDGKPARSGSLMSRQPRPRGD